ncbi:MAG: hypothetical protein M3418_07610, partial [Gemmatimonadota bacterium]|nr:hypothetical protein [Gemmatimonadota bacterium]
MSPTPEQEARVQIDAALEAAGTSASYVSAVTTGASTESASPGIIEHLLGLQRSLALVQCREHGRPQRLLEQVRAFCRPFFDWY